MKTKSVIEKNMKVCLVGSSGGHLTHLYMLKPFWKDKNRFWVTFDKEDARSLLEGEKVYPCYFPTNRSIKALIKNTKIAWDSWYLLNTGNRFSHLVSGRPVKERMCTSLMMHSGICTTQIRMSTISNTALGRLEESLMKCWMNIRRVKTG